MRQQARNPCVVDNISSARARLAELLRAASLEIYAAHESGESLAKFFAPGTDIYISYFRATITGAVPHSRARSEGRASIRCCTCRHAR